jgi:hypothetical protein
LSANPLWGGGYLVFDLNVFCAVAVGYIEIADLKFQWDAADVACAFKQG